MLGALFNMMSQSSHHQTSQLGKANGSVAEQFEQLNQFASMFGLGNMHSNGFNHAWGAPGQTGVAVGMQTGGDHRSGERGEYSKF